MSELLEHISAESLTKQVATLKQQIEGLRIQLTTKEGQLRAINQLLQTLSPSRPRIPQTKHDAQFKLEAVGTTTPKAFADYIREACESLHKIHDKGFETRDVRNWLFENAPTIEFKAGTVGNSLQKMLERGELIAVVQGRKGMATIYTLGPRFSEYSRPS